MAYNYSTVKPFDPPTQNTINTHTYIHTDDVKLHEFCRVLKFLSIVTDDQ